MAELNRYVRKLNSLAEELTSLVTLEINENSEDSLLHAHDIVYIVLKRFNRVATELSERLNSKNLDKELLEHNQYDSAILFIWDQKRWRLAGGMGSVRN